MKVHQKLDLWTLFSDIRILKKGRTRNEDSILEVLSVMYGDGMVSHDPTAAVYEVRWN